MVKLRDWAVHATPPIFRRYARWRGVKLCEMCANLASVACLALQTRWQKMGCRFLGRALRWVVAMIATSVSGWFCYHQSSDTHRVVTQTGVRNRPY
ncbi:hypothetical protein [Arsenophonus nasoniae]|uniref:hypothetical protein n=1 Tax=Arsenophonus nasoniae TaxID=638 RepID=UPI0012DD5ECB|nr:hypothetical protein [Arsenophonus nasoniae]